MTFYAAPTLGRKRRVLPSVTLPTFRPNGIFLTPKSSLSKAAALGVTDAPSGLISVWLYLNLRTAAERAAQPTPLFNYGDFVDLISCKGIDGVTDSEHVEGVNLVFDQLGLRINFGASGQTSLNAAAGYNAIIPPSVFLGKNNRWMHLLIGYDMGLAAGAKRFFCAVDGLDTGVTGAEIGSITGAFTPAINSARGFGLKLQNTGGDVGECAFAAYWHEIGFNAFTGAGGTFNAALLGKFIAGGKPVDLGVNGAVPTGTSPQIFLDGPRTTFGTNKGRVAFNLAATNIYNHSHGPGGPLPGRAYHKWAAVGLSANSATSMVISAQSNGIKAGDFLVLTVILVHNNTAAQTLNTPAGWTPIVGPFKQAPGGYDVTCAEYWKFAVVDNEALPNVTYVNATTQANAWVLSAYGNVNTVTPIEASSVKGNTPLSTNIASNPLTSLGADRLLVQTSIGYWNGNNPDGQGLTVPPEQDCRFELKSPANIASVAISDEIVGAGLTVARTATKTQATPSIAITKLLRAAA